MSKWRAVRDDYLEDADRELFVQDDEMEFKSRLGGCTNGARGT